MPNSFSMNDTFECANCGREGDRYVMEEAMRRCGTGYGEWYCMEGEGCNAKIEDGHYKCCNAPTDLGHMFGCPNSKANTIGFDLMGGE